MPVCFELGLEMADASREFPQESQHEVRPTRQDLAEIDLVEDQACHVVDRDGASRSGLMVEQCHFPEEVPLSEGGDLFHGLPDDDVRILSSPLPDDLVQEDL